MIGEPRVVRHVVLRGRVQGVGFRYWTEDTAIELGVEGWVRNRRDGAVEAVFSGSPEQVAAMVDACRRGPPGARVDGIEARDGGPELLGGRRGFVTLPTV